MLKANGWWVTAASPASPPLGVGPGQRKPEKPKRARQSLSLLADSTFGLAWAAALSVRISVARTKAGSFRRSRAGHVWDGVFAECQPRDGCVTSLRDRRALAQVPYRARQLARPPRLRAKADRPAARAFLLSAQPRDAMVLTSFGQAMGAPKRKTLGARPGAEQKAPASRRRDPRGSIPRAERAHSLPSAARLGASPDAPRGFRERVPSGSWTCPTASLSPQPASAALPPPAGPAARPYRLLPARHGDGRRGRAEPGRGYKGSRDT